MHVFVFLFKDIRLRICLFELLACIFKTCSAAAGCDLAELIELQMIADISLRGVRTISPD